MFINLYNTKEKKIKVDSDCFTYSFFCLDWFVHTFFKFIENVIVFLA